MGDKEANKSQYIEIASLEELHKHIKTQNLYLINKPPFTEALCVFDRQNHILPSSFAECARKAAEVNGLDISGLLTA